MTSYVRFTLSVTVLLCVVTSLLCLLDCKGGTDHHYSVEEIREDFAYLYETLQASTYDLFLNTEKSDFDREYERIYNSISEPMTYLQINRLFQPFVALAGFSHCTLDFPSVAYRRWYEDGGRFFPFDITFAGDRMLVLINWSENEDIVAGDEIMAINDKSVEQVLREMFVYISGENDYAKRTLIEICTLMDWYWYVFGEYRTGTVRIKKQDGHILDLVVDGIDLDDYREVAKSVQQVSFIKEGREFKFIADIAYLHPGTFLNASSNDITKSDTFRNEEFLDFLESAFTEIARRKAENLIVDIRGNNGGDNSFSDPMIAYFADEPFRIASSFRVRTSQMTKEFWKDIDIPALSELKHQIMTLENGTRFEADSKKTEPRNDYLSFKGRVFVLIDRFTCSNAAVVAAVIQDYDFGYLIGEETSYVPSSCAAVHTFDLPQTKMRVVYPKACSIRPNGDPSMRGVIPDLEAIGDVFTEQDEVLERALELIRS